MFDQLAGEFEFFLVTLNRDIGDKSPYKGVATDCWTSVGNVSVLYVDPDRFKTAQIPELVQGLAPDALYLNSFWDSAFSQPILRLRRFGLLPDLPVVLAPRGEFSPGALRIKQIRKRIYLFLNRLFGFTDDLFWHASSAQEESYIKDVVRRGGPHRIQVAENLNATTVGEGDVRTGDRSDSTRPLRICFLARISKMKNLDYAIRTLREVSGSVEFDIFGPIEDSDYWETCRSGIDALPANVRCCYKGEVAPDKVPEVLEAYDLFYLPTKGENFGHVIFEALAAGTPVLISDQTPWGQVESECCGWALGLEKHKPFTDCINSLVNMSLGDRRELRLRALDYARKKANDSVALEANRRLFKMAIKQCNGDGNAVD